MPLQRQQINGQPIPPPLRTARDIREWAAELGVDPALVVLDVDGYPYSDGIPEMVEGYEHTRQLDYVSPILRARYWHRPDVYVSRDNYVHGTRIDGGILSVAPDLCVAFGIDPRPRDRARRSYRIGKDGPAPSFALEVLSDSTKDNDLDAKQAIYAYFGVAEYWILDPWGDEVPDHVVGHRLRGGGYEPIAPSPDGSTRSAALGLYLRFEADFLRLRDAATGEELLSLPEIHAAYAEEQAAHMAAQAAYDEEQALRMEEQARREAAEAENARLRALLQLERRPSNS